MLQAQGLDGAGGPFFLGRSCSEWPACCAAASVRSLTERLRFFGEGLEKGFKN